jgi:hypothetical protein
VFLVVFRNSFYLIPLGVLLVTVSCGTKQQPEAPNIDALRAAFLAELRLLNKDLAKIVSAAPQGLDNAVFDLTAVVAEPGNPTEGLKLTWTERLTGDYNQDGLVSINDLTPISANWNASIQYDAPELHGGFSDWPTGDPDSAGAPNWRLARVDGDTNGLITISELTPLASHLGEKLSGYRVFRKGPSDPSFIQLENPRNPASLLTVDRPVASTSVPVRYSFTDFPPESGIYEYYVVAYSNGDGASPITSNIAQASIEAGFNDTTPPNWTTTIGITNATANVDGTVTVTFGSAEDSAVPPAPASPPVIYTVYYSTTSPINFQTAARVSNVASPWTSQPLVANQTYHFAVRTADSAVPPNEDLNTTELPVVIDAASPVTDTEPPAWIERGPDALAGPEYQGDQTVIKGFSMVRSENGKIIITCADASDELSPPVRYDLYYLDSRNGTVILNQADEIVPEAHVVQDIPKVFELEWPNRLGVTLLVRARDSAPVSNQDDNEKTFTTAAGGMNVRSIDESLPGLFEGADVESDCIFDPERRSYLAAYILDEDDLNRVVRFATLDAGTAQWVVETAVAETHPGAWLDSPELLLSWKREIWLKVRRNITSSDAEFAYYKRTNGGSWQRWFPGTEKGFWSKQFDHNGNLAFFSEQPSAVQNGRFAISYEWWNEAQQTWISEPVSDPGGKAYTFVRPNGVVQLISAVDFKEFGDTTAVSGRLLERSPGGSWTQILSGVGLLSPETGYPYPRWESEWFWAAKSTIRGQEELLVSTATGYEFVPILSQDGGDGALGTVAWPANGGYHALPNLLWQGNSFFNQASYTPEYSAYIPTETQSLEAVKVFQKGTFLFNPVDGFYSYLRPGWDVDAGRYGLVIYTYPPGHYLFGSEL